MICSSEKRFFTSNLLGVGNWTTNQGATQNRGDVGPTTSTSVHNPAWYPIVSRTQCCRATAEQAGITP
ncbi:hypothetical protein EBA05_18095 [Xanthomonas oryzae pv. oryzae]|nr:hypothetical protein C0L90_18045 [Xanthomonas oryzae pv. oryzae]QBI17116.1 hypothetical protein EYR03_18320 [Xanthomonas oryzae pv. oryzae]QBN23984.1 hypothetical protein EBA00_04565 [Xanthomonas oryzae pv. oryzae]QBN40427.1 hypothetical protein EBA04_18265 [Xanthomonas oryzae pv. oryzae]QBN44073.1 hypothetical protein EBA05_18095 [Xanthomonas oryzae pv. oryzae]